MIVDGERVARFVSQDLGFALCPPYYALGMERDGQITGGAILNHFEGVDVHVTMAGKRWSLEFTRALGRYIFDTLGCERMTGITERDHIVRLVKRLGGQVEGCLRNHFGRGRDGIVVGILRDEWRY